MSENAHNIYGAPQPLSSQVAFEDDNTSGMGKDHPVPVGVKGWSWGAFIFNWIWAIANKTWIGLLVFIPYVGLIVAIILGIKGREWAWQNRRWESLEHFNRVQNRWNIWGACLCVTVTVAGIVVAIAIPIYINV